MESIHYNGFVLVLGALRPVRVIDNHYEVETPYGILVAESNMPVSMLCRELQDVIDGICSSLNYTLN